jgi:hypothetical protein
MDPELQGVRMKRQQGVTADIPETACPQCNLSIGSLVGVGGRRPPRRGDFCVCHNCGAILRIAEGLALELVDPAKVNVPPAVLARVYEVRELVGDMNERAADANPNRHARRGTAAQIRRRGRLPS